MAGKVMKKLTVSVASLALCALLLACPALAETSTRGAVTKLLIPRFVSLKTSEGNVRRGPSLTHRIDWILKLRNMPLQVVAEHGHWRKVLDFEGAGGWIHYSLLSGARTVMIKKDTVDILDSPLPDSAINARLQRNVLAWLSACELEWCEITADGYKGWAPKAALWGVSAEELFE